MKILTVTSGKGGVGKSTITLNIARQLSLAGKRTLLVDFDIHNKGVSGLFLPKILETSSSVTTIVSESSGFSHGNSPESVAALQFIRITLDANLFLLPASRPQEMIAWSDFHGAENVEIVQFFRTLLTNVAAHFNFDVVVIDCYGGIDSLTVAAAGIADDTIIVNEPDLITFSGTLQLYMYLRKQYSGAERQIRLHFVINRITYRHSFAFLDSEYKKHLTKLAIDDKILAYFPYDKLLIETFGDYPFFTELLPKGLFTLKIRLLVETLWGDDPAFRGFSHLSEKKKTAVFRRTVENLFADPDRILRAAVTLPFWLIVPTVMLFALYKGLGGSLDYRMIQFVFYTACVILALLSLTIGFFEPIQISRWLWREATYHRRKRSLKKEKGAVYRGLISAADGVRGFLPSAVAVLFLLAGAYYISKERSEIIRLSLAVWPGKIDGFRPGGNYTGIMLRQGATIMGGDLSDAQFGEATLAGVTFENVTLDNASFNCANLSNAVFRDSRASGASFRPCNANNLRLRGVTFLNGAQFVNTTLTGAHFSYAYLWNVKFTNKSRLNYAEFGCAFLRGSSFENSSAIKATFKCDQASPTSPISMVDVRFEDVDFTNANFTNVDLRGAEFDDFTIKTMLASGVIDDGTAKNLTRKSAQTSLPTRPLSGAGQCADADCEYSRATTQISNYMPDLVESLILKGGRQDWEAAKVGLNEIKTSPGYEYDRQLQGQYALLNLLLRLVSHQLDDGTTHEWCTWISKNHTVTSWQWNIWDHEVPKLHLSAEVLAKIKVVEASAQGQPTRGLCISDSK